MKPRYPNGSEIRSWDTRLGNPSYTCSFFTLPQCLTEKGHKESSLEKGNGLEMVRLPRSGD